MKKERVLGIDVEISIIWGCHDQEEGWIKKERLRLIAS